MTCSALTKAKKKGDSIATWAKLKFDRQIVAIAKVCGATEIYSDDSDVKAIAKEIGTSVIGLAELPLPPEPRSSSLTLSRA